jgi:hypothetical protein
MQHNNKVNFGTWLQNRVKFHWFKSSNLSKIQSSITMNKHGSKIWWNISEIKIESVENAKQRENLSSVTCAWKRKKDLWNSICNVKLDDKVPKIRDYEARSVKCEARRFENVWRWRVRRMNNGVRFVGEAQSLKMRWWNSTVERIGTRWWRNVMVGEWMWIWLKMMKAPKICSNCVEDLRSWIDLWFLIEDLDDEGENPNILCIVVELRNWEKI